MRPRWRKCPVHHFSLSDPDFGVMHLRRPTWFPFTMQVDVNGREWLAYQMRRSRWVSERPDDAVLSIASPQRAQALSDESAKLAWPAVLDELAHRFNPPHDELLETLG